MKTKRQSHFVRNTLIKVKVGYRTWCINQCYHTLS